MKIDRNHIITYLQSNKIQFQKEFGVKRIGIFGSCARNEHNENSDIDVVVELENPDLFSLIGIKQIMEERFKRKVDIVRLRDKMNISLKEKIQRDAIYA